MLKAFPVALAVALCPLPALAEEDASTMMLKGLRRVAVLVEKIDSELEQVGVTQNELRTLVELRLRRMGMEVVALRGRTPGTPMVEVTATAMNLSDSLVACSMELRIDESVILDRNKKWLPGAYTWSQATLGRFGSAKAVPSVEQMLNGLLNKLENDWLSVNSPR